MLAPMALRGPPRAPGDFQEALLGSMEPTKPMGANLAPTTVEGRPASSRRALKPPQHPTQRGKHDKAMLLHSPPVP